MPNQYSGFALCKDHHPSTSTEMFIRALLVALLMACMPGHVLAQTIVEQGVSIENGTKQKNAIENLISVQQSIELKRGAVREIRNQLEKVEDVSERKELEQKIERIKNDISNLQLSYEQIALGGINLSVPSNQSEQKINWKDEIEQISRPILSTLKELTEKPRQLDGLRSKIELMENQMKEIHKAINSIQSLKVQTLPTGAADMLNQLQIDWGQRRDDTRRELEVARYKLSSLKAEEESWQQNTWEKYCRVSFWSRPYFVSCDDNKFGYMVRL